MTGRSGLAPCRLPHKSLKTPWQAYLSRQRKARGSALYRSIRTPSRRAARRVVRRIDPTGPRFFQVDGKTRLKLHHTYYVGFPFAGIVRAFFGNSHACRLMASRDGPGAGVDRGP
jgi:hypothetical protein